MRQVRAKPKIEIAKKSTLTVREQRIVANVLAGMSTGKAITEAGGNPTSHSFRRRLQPGGDLWAAAVAALEEEGVTLSHIAKRVKESLDAKETKFFTHKGRVEETRDVVAHGVRLNAAEVAYRALGIFPPPTKDDPATNTGPPAIIIAVRTDSSPPINSALPALANGVRAGAGNAGDCPNGINREVWMKQYEE